MAFYDNVYTPTVEAAKAAASSATSAFNASTDYGIVLFVGFIAFFCLILMFWWGFVKAAGLYVSLGGKQGGQPQPMETKNLGSLFFLPLTYMFVGLVIFIFIKEMSSLAWDVDFPKEMKLFLEFRLVNYEAMIDGMSVGSQASKMIASLIDLLSRVTLVFLAFMLVVILICSLVFAFAILSSINPQAGQSNSYKMAVIIILITITILFILGGAFVLFGNLIYFKEPITVDGFGEIRNVSDALFQILKYYTKIGLLGGNA